MQSFLLHSLSLYICDVMKCEEKKRKKKRKRKKKKRGERCIDGRNKRSNCMYVNDLNGGGGWKRKRKKKKEKEKKKKKREEKGEGERKYGGESEWE